MDGQVVQDWSYSPIWSWTAAKDQVGQHVIEAKVRDGKHNQDGDSSSSANFEIFFAPNNAPVMSSLTADKESPQMVGTTITWTAIIESGLGEASPRLPCSCYKRRTLPSVLIKHKNNA